MKRLPSLLLLLGLVLLACACSRQAGGPVPPDLTPVGEGLRVIGFSLVAVAVILSVGRIVR